jgi:group II intron reverse transcriptase/maturase
MREAETILGIIRERGRRRLPLKDIYRLLYNRNLYLRAYGKLYRNDGAMTPGATPETVDGMSLGKIEAIIAALRQECYRWTPVRRTYVPKKSGKLRPLGLPSWSDKLLQEVIRSLLEAYYEPQFSARSHGFRAGRGCHTALTEITRYWHGVKWFIEGDLCACFDSLDHGILLAILCEQLQDNRFLTLMARLLEAGYLEDWRFNTTLSGVPQGSIVGPLLSNVYLDRLDRFVEAKLLPAYNCGKKRKPYPPYRALMAAARKKRATGEHEEARKLRQQAQSLPSRDPLDPDFRRLWYCRYADDWLLGFSGPRQEAEAIKEQLAEFLSQILKLELSQEKTLITHARTEAARFLGYEVIAQHADCKQHRSQRRRCINGVTGLRIPTEVIQAKCARYLRNGKPVHLSERMQDSDYSIVATYQAEYRGVVQYYRLAYNVDRLGRLRGIMQLSLAKTLAGKHKTRALQILRRHRTKVSTPHGEVTALEVVQERGKGQKPLVARFGGIELRRQQQAILDDQPKPIYNGRTELVQRLLARECELCGSPQDCEVHHVRKLANLDLPGRKEKAFWAKRMAARQRKTLVVCRHCHQAIHAGQAPKPLVTVEITGEPRATETGMRGSEGDRWKSAPRGNSPAVYPTNCSYSTRLARA